MISKRWSCFAALAAVVTWGCSDPVRVEQPTALATPSLDGSTILCDPTGKFAAGSSGTWGYGSHFIFTTGGFASANGGLTGGVRAAGSFNLEYCYVFNPNAQQNAYGEQWIYRTLIKSNGQVHNEPIANTAGRNDWTLYSGTTVLTLDATTERIFLSIGHGQLPAIVYPNDLAYLHEREFVLHFWTAIPAPQLVVQTVSGGAQLSWTFARRYFAEQVQRSCSGGTWQNLGAAILDPTTTSHVYTDTNASAGCTYRVWARFSLGNTYYDVVGGNIAQDPGHFAGTFSNVVTYQPACGTPTITTASPLPQATRTVAYSMSFAKTGGCGTASWQVASGTLPSGLSLSSSGHLSGTPTLAGTSNFTIRVTDSGGTTTKAFSLTVNQPLTATIWGGWYQIATNETCTFRSSVQGGSGPITYTWYRSAYGGGAETIVSTSSIYTAVPPHGSGFRIRLLASRNGQSAGDLMDVAVAGFLNACEPYVP